MAGAFKHGRRWYLRVKDATGEWRKLKSTARTKAQAMKLAAETELQYERQRLGLEAAPAADGGGTLAELLDWWLETYSKGSPSHDRNVGTVRAHFAETDLGRTTLAALSSGALETFLQAKSKSLAPQTVNHLRRFVLTAFNKARAAGRYGGPNPAAVVKRRRVPRRKPDYLKAEEVPRVLEALTDRWQPLFAAAIYTGLRKGELFALRKVDVDLGARLLTVAGSHGRDTTKGGHADVIPIAAELVPYLEHAIRTSPSALVFPREDGTRMRPDTPVADVLRAALGRAGIVTGYRHGCRRKGCGHAELAPDASARRCPVDGRKLWPKPEVRPIRFHDLRHTTGSLLMMAGANPAAVQRILRHSDPRITTEVYGHLAPEYLRAEVDRLAFGLKATVDEADPASARRAVGATPIELVPSLSQKTPRDPDDRGGGARKARATQALDVARPAGFEPAAPGLEGAPRNVQRSPGTCNRLQTLESAATSSPPASRAQQPSPRSLSHPCPKAPASLRAVRGADYLTVRDIAGRLDVSTATVYALVERGELAHVRVSNAIRIAPADLAAFEERNRKGARR